MKQKREKKPYWKIEYSRRKMSTTFYLKFINMNRNTSIGSLFINSIDDGFKIDMNHVSENEGYQEFTLTITPKDYSSLETSVIELDYDTFDGYQYKQSVTINKGQSSDYELVYGTVVEVQETE